MKYVIFIISLFIISSCGETPVLEKSFELPSGVWNYADKLDFPIEVEDTLSKYRLEMQLQHSTEYNYQNLYTRIKTDFPNGRSATDTVSIQLSDKYGRWFGKCNSNDCAYRVVLKDSFNFVEAGKHNLNIEQYSRTDYLEGVEELSFALYRY